MEVQKALVYYHSQKAGTLIKTNSGYEFVYDPVYLAGANAGPVSLSLPLTPNKFFNGKSGMFNLVDNSELSPAGKEKIKQVISERYSRLFDIGLLNR